MRRFISILVAGAMALGTTSVSFAPAQATVRLVRPPVTEPAATIQKVEDRRYGNQWWGGGYTNWKPRRHHRRHDDFYFPRHGFYFEFPFPRRYAYRHAPRCRDLVMGHDGRWHCYRW